MGDRVLAKWQDCKFYPAKVTKGNPDGKLVAKSTFQTLFFFIYSKFCLLNLRLSFHLRSLYF